jgi:hypothetical protein
VGSPFGPRPSPAGNMARLAQPTGVTRHACAVTARSAHVVAWPPAASGATRCSGTGDCGTSKGRRVHRARLATFSAVAASRSVAALSWATTATVWSYNMRMGGRIEALVNWRMGVKVAVLTKEARSAVALWHKIDNDDSAPATNAGQVDSPLWGSCSMFFLAGQSGHTWRNRRGGRAAQRLLCAGTEEKKGGRRGARPAWVHHAENKRRREVGGVRCAWRSSYPGGGGAGSIGR